MSLKKEITIYFHVYGSKKIIIMLFGTIFENYLLSIFFFFPSNFPFWTQLVLCSFFDRKVVMAFWILCENDPPSWTKPHAHVRIVREVRRKQNFITRHHPLSCGTQILAFLRLWDSPSLCIGGFYSLFEPRGLHPSWQIITLE